MKRKDKKLYFKLKIRQHFPKKGFKKNDRVIDGEELNNIFKVLVDKATNRTAVIKRKIEKPFKLFLRIYPLPEIDYTLLDKILEKLQDSKVQKRGIMFYDIVNYIARHKHDEPPYDQIMLWCNANIKNGRTFYP
ncbi:MAG: hypothetical protein ACTSR8_11210 [Promethearchaeota archaeon]